MKINLRPTTAMAIAALAVGTALFGGCGGGGGGNVTTNNNQVVSVTGHLVDKDGGGTLANLKVSVQGQTETTVTDANGNFTLNNVTPGTITIVFSDSINSNEGSVSEVITGNQNPQNVGTISIAAGPPPPPF